MSRVGRQAEITAIALDDWLKAEVATSFVGNNSVLDGSTDERLATLQESIRLPYGDLNVRSVKHESHANRLEHFFAPYGQNRLTRQEQEFVDGRLNFAALMAVSGAYRTQCLLESTSASEYLSARLNGSGVDIEKIVYGEIRSLTPTGKISSADISLAGLKKRFDYTFAQGELHVRGVIARADMQQGEDGVWEVRGINEIGQENSQSALAMKKEQIGYIKLATDSILWAAKQRRARLGEVPFLEPRSITEQSGDVHYPLKNRVDWLPLLFKSSLS